MPAAAILVFPLASLAVAPVTAMIALAAVVFGPYQGFLVSLAGITLAAALNYGIGAFFGRSLVRRLAGPRVDRPGYVSQDVFGSAHTSGWQAAMCDGSVKTFRYEIELDTHRRLGNRADGLAIDDNSP